MAFGLRGQDAWRRHPIFKWTWLDAMPGIREGAALFVAFWAAEKTYEYMGGGAHGGHGAHGAPDAHGAHPAAPAAKHH